MRRLKKFRKAGGGESAGTQDCMTPKPSSSHYSFGVSSYKLVISNNTTSQDSLTSIRVDF